MTADHESEAGSFGRRLEKWTRDSAELQGGSELALGTSSSPEEATVRRYELSTTAKVDLPEPSMSQSRYEASSQRHRDLSRRLVLTLVLVVPLLAVLGVVVGPIAMKVAILALLVPVAGLMFHDSRALGRINHERHLTLQGGLADAWSAWVSARAQLDSLDNASQARAALAANEPRMQALVLALGRAEARSDHQDTEEYAASREWIYRSAAKAVALATAERELEANTQRQVDAGDLQIAPEGDLGALDHAIDTARELTRGVDDSP